MKCQRQMLEANKKRCKDQAEPGGLASGASASRTSPSNQQGPCQRGRGNTETEVTLCSKESLASILDP